MAQDPFLTKQSLAGVVERVSLTPPPPPVLILECSTPSISRISFNGVTTDFDNSNYNPGGFWHPIIKHFFKAAYDYFDNVDKIHQILMTTPIYVRIHCGPSVDTQTYHQILPKTCSISSTPETTIADIMYEDYTEKEISLSLSIQYGYDGSQTFFRIHFIDITLQGFSMDIVGNTMLDINY